ncbi:MAG: JAB domain-containing protein [Enterocloster bolteae]
MQHTRYLLHVRRKYLDYYMEDMRHLEQEKSGSCSEYQAGALIRDLHHGQRTVNASVVTPSEVLMGASRCRAVSMVLVHNHPSGDPTPSRADMLLTKRLKEAGDLVGITLIDHIVIGDRRYLSFREENLM